MGKGGDVLLSPGPGPASNGNIILCLADGSEMLRFNSDGTAFVRGSVCDVDKLIYASFRIWLEQAILTIPATGKIRWQRDK